MAKLKDLSPREQYDYLYNQAIAQGKTSREANQIAANGVEYIRQYKAEEANKPLSTGQQVGLGLTSAGGGAAVGVLGSKGAEGLYSYLTSPDKEATKDITKEVANQTVESGSDALTGSTSSAAEPIGQTANGEIIYSDGSTAALPNSMIGNMWMDPATPGLTQAGSGLTGGIGLGGLAAGGYTGYQQAMGLKNALKGKDMSFIEQAALALPTFGTSFLYNSLLGGPTVEEIQQKRAQSLLDQGVTGFENYYNTAKQGAADRLESGLTDKWGYNQNLGADFVGYDENGNWINNVFAKSRNEADLRPEDVWGGAGLFETFGDDWLGKYTAEQRRQISQALLDNKLIDERKAGIYVTDPARALEIAQQYLDPTPKTQQPLVS